MNSGFSAEKGCRKLIFHKTMGRISHQLLNHYSTKQSWEGLEAQGREWFCSTWLLLGGCFLPGFCPGYSSALFNHSHLGIRVWQTGTCWIFLSDLWGPEEGQIPGSFMENMLDLLLRSLKRGKSYWVTFIIFNMPDMKMQSGNLLTEVLSKMGHNLSNSEELGAVVKILMLV